MKVVPPNPDDVRAVALLMRQRDRDEFMPLTHFTEHHELVSSLTERFGEHPDCFVVMSHDGPVAVGGMLLHRPNVATLLFFASDAFAGRVAADFTRFVKQRLFPGYVAKGVHRIECQSLEDYTSVHNWLEVLGLKREATMPGFGRGGETYIQFSWTKP
jgi:hypothetical protein